VLIGFGPGIAVIPLLPLMKSNLAGNENEIGSLVSSAFQLSTSLGGFLGPLIGGFMVTRMPQTRELTCKESESSIGCTSGYNSSMLLFGLLCLAWSFLLMIGLAPDTPLKQTETYLVIEGEDQEKDETRYQSTDLTSSSAPAVSTPESLKRVIRS
jgi:MFS family permease